LLLNTEEIKAALEVGPVVCRMFYSRRLDV